MHNKVECVCRAVILRCLREADCGDAPSKWKLKSKMINKRSYDTQMVSDVERQSEKSRARSPIKTLSHSQSSEGFPHSEVGRNHDAEADRCDAMRCIQFTVMTHRTASTVSWTGHYESIGMTRNGRIEAR